MYHSIHKRTVPATLKSELIAIVQAVVEDKPESETWSAVLSLLSRFHNYQKGLMVGLVMSPFLGAVSFRYLLPIYKVLVSIPL